MPFAKWSRIMWTLHIPTTVPATMIKLRFFDYRKSFRFFVVLRYLPLTADSFQSLHQNSTAKSGQNTTVEHYR